MSHLKERIEINCLNCNAIVNGKYCSVCGQENIEPKESAWQLIVHFFNDITHFDGKFFSSLKYLMFKPGFLSSEYMRGRRQAYLNPIRFYIFTSFIFFLVVFAFFVNKSAENNFIKFDDGDNTKLTVEQKAKVDSLNNLISSTPTKRNSEEKKGSVSSNEFYFSKFKSKEQYDSLLKINMINDNYLTKVFTYKRLELKEKYIGNETTLNAALWEKFLHNLPLMFLFSLPFFAIFLKLIYIRQKKYFYVAHTIFAVHLYVFTYIAILLNLGCTRIYERSHLGFLNLLGGFILVYILYYWYKSFRFFYEQGRFKTVIKFFLVFLWLLFILVLLFVLFFFYSFYKM